MKSFCVQSGIELKKRLISLRKEFFRKTIHVCTAFVPLVMHFSKEFVLAGLFTALVLYIIAETLRYRGREIPLISDITAAAARKRDENKFVMGPVTLVLGVISAILIFDEVASSAGILALAFGDGLASLAGKTFGKIKIPFMQGKTAAGSLTCWAAIFCSSFAITGSTETSIVCAIAGAVFEVLPLKDFDNLIIPSLTGTIVTVML